MVANLRERFESKCRYIDMIYDSLLRSNEKLFEENGELHAHCDILEKKIKLLEKKQKENYIFLLAFEIINFMFLGYIVLSYF